MSRIGNLPINLPKGVTIAVNDSNEVSVKGPLGQLTLAVDNEMKIEVAEDQILVVRPSE